MGAGPSRLEVLLVIAQDHAPGMLTDEVLASAYQACTQLLKCRFMNDRFIECLEVFAMRGAWQYKCRQYMIVLKDVSGSYQS